MTNFSSPFRFGKISQQTKRRRLSPALNSTASISHAPERARVAATASSFPVAFIRRVILALTFAACLFSSQIATAQNVPLPSQVWKVDSDADAAKGERDGKREDADTQKSNAERQSNGDALEEVFYDLSPIDTDENLIRDAVRLRKMMNKDQLKEIQFEIDVRLTYHNPFNSQIRLIHQEGDECVRFYGAFADPDEVRPRLGALMRVRGRTGCNHGGHIIVDSWKQIGAAVAPKAVLIPSTVAAKQRFKYQSQYCEIRGVLSEVFIRNANYHLAIKTQSGLHVWSIRLADGKSRTFARMIGKRVSATGVMMSISDREGERIGTQLYAMELQQIRFSSVEGPEPEFERIEGTVVAKDMENWLGITDRQTVHWVYTDASSQVPLFSNAIVMCERKNANATESTWLSRVFLMDGINDSPAPEVLTASEIVDLEFAAQPITTTATVQAVYGRPDAVEVRMKEGQVPFIVRMNHSSDKSFRKLLSEGNILQFTGVRRSFPATHKGPAAFKMIVNDLTSVQLVSQPSHLYAKQIGMIALAVLSLLGAVLAWNYSLRSTVRAKTKSIREIANRLQASCDATLDGMMFFDRDDRLVQVTGCAVELLDADSRGQVAAEAAGQKIATQMKDAPSFWGEWQSAFRGRKNDARSEHVMERESTNLALHIAPILNSGDEYDGRICTFRDVTEQRKMEQDLVQSQKEIAVGRLAGGIAHDFNNLLMAISVNIALAQRNGDDGQVVQHHTSIAQDAVDRASELTRQLLDFSRRGELSVDVAHLNDCVTKVGELAKHLLGDNIELCLQMSPDLALAKIDTTQIEHVLLNLCINARDSIDSSGGHISISTSNHSHSILGPCVRISVEDDGQGMNDETAAMAFEPFFTTKEVGQGTGLGLAIAYGIVKQHGGIINCESKLGRGTRFDIFLPQTTESRSESASSNNSTLWRISMNTNTMRVLLVDDEPMIRDAGTALLAALGHESVCVADGQSALNLLDRDSDFDVVLLDLTMPFMSGSETLKRIKSKFPQLSVIICSGYSVDIESLGDDPSTAPEAVLSKPFSIEDIRRVLEVSKTQNV